MYEGNRKKFAALAILAGFMVNTRARVSAESGDANKDLVGSGAAEVVDGAVHKDAKVGYVDMNALLEQIPGADQRKLQIEEYAAALEKNLKDRVESLTAEVNQLQNAKDLTDAERQEKYKALVEKNKEIEQFDSNKLNLIQQKYIEVMRPVFAQISKASEEIAKEGHYDFILSRSVSGSIPAFGSDVVLYGKAEFDLTQSVLDRIKKGMQEKAPVVGRQLVGDKKTAKDSKGRSLKGKGFRGK